MRVQISEGRQQLLNTGTKLGPYQILAFLGAGGVGEEEQSSVNRPQPSIMPGSDDDQLMIEHRRLNTASLTCH